MKFRVFAAALIVAGSTFAMAGTAGAVTPIVTSQLVALDQVADGQKLGDGGPITNNQIMIDNFGDTIGGVAGPTTPLAGFTFVPNVVDQDGLAPGYIRSGPALLSSESAPPPVGKNPDGTPNYEPGNYYTVTSEPDGVLSPGAQTNTAVLTTLSGYFTTFSFYLGSPDPYNTVAFYDAGGHQISSLTYGDIWACPSCNPDGDQAFGARAIYDFSSFGADHVTSITFTSSGNSFEFDNLAGAIASIPEPASWALMIMGFGLAGGMVRAQRRQTAEA